MFEDCVPEMAFLHQQKVGHILHQKHFRHQHRYNAGVLKVKLVAIIKKIAGSYLRVPLTRWTAKDQINVLQSVLFAMFFTTTLEEKVNVAFVKRNLGEIVTVGLAGKLVPLDCYFDLETCLFDTLAESTTSGEQ